LSIGGLFWGPTDLRGLFGSWAGLCPSRMVKKEWVRVVFIVAWYVWLGQNELVFEEVRHDPETVLARIQRASFSISIAHGGAFSFSDWLIRLSFVYTVV
jgi:hypothetical protein